MKGPKPSGVLEVVLNVGGFVFNVSFLIQKKKSKKMTKARAIIRDGYNETVFLKAVERIHESVTFDFRPMLPALVRELTDGFSSKPAKIQTSIMFETLAQNIVKWNITEADGSPVPVTIENLKRIKTRLLERLFDVVTGYDGGDDPAEHVEEDGEEFDAKTYLADLQKEDRPTGEPLDLVESAKN